LSFRLPQGAFRPGQREFEFARIELNENLTGAHFLAEFDRHIGHDAAHFAADSNLVGRNERSRKVDEALDRNALNGRGFNRDGRAASGSASTPLSTAALAFSGFGLSLSFGRLSFVTGRKYKNGE